MREDELRAIVRDVIARRGEVAVPRGPGSPTPSPAHHPSHAQFRLPTGGEGSGPCLIEPSVACVHCGYCQVYGH